MALGRCGVAALAAGSTLLLALAAFGEAPWLSAVPKAFQGPPQAAQGGGQAHEAPPLLKAAELPPLLTVTGAGTFYERVYYRGNVSNCSGQATPRRALSLNADGAAAGPIIPCSSKELGSCDALGSLMGLDAMRDLATGRAFRFPLPPQRVGEHEAIVMDRPRMSSATGVVFLDKKHFVVASFGRKRLYLYEYDVAEDGRMSTRLLDEAQTTGTPDLVDYDARRGLLTSSQLFRGTQDLHKVDLARRKILHYKEVDTFGGLGQWCHESAFYPSKTATVLVASTNKIIRRSSLMIRFFDYEKEEVLAEFRMQSSKATRGFHIKSVRFLDRRHFLATATAFKAARYKDCPAPEFEEPEENIGRVLLFRMDFSVEDVAKGRRAPATSDDFQVIGVYNVGFSALDGIAYKDGLAVVADQVNDKILGISVDVKAKTPLRRAFERTGYHMPHGVAFSKSQAHFAVTCYGDNSFFLHKSL